MRIMIDIPDDTAAALRTHVLQHRRPVAVPGGGTVIAPVYASVGDFLAEQMGLILKGLMLQYPPVKIQEKLAEIKKAEAEIEVASKVTIEELP
jgi:hypothetical protein